MLLMSSLSKDEDTCSNICVHVCEIAPLIVKFMDTVICVPEICTICLYPVISMSPLLDGNWTIATNSTTSVDDS